MKVTASPSGYIDFFLCDRSLYLWLDYLIFSISTSPIPQLVNFSPQNKLLSDRLFPLCCIYKRCGSLLSLGKSEGLIRVRSKQESSNLQNLGWIKHRTIDFPFFMRRTKTIIPTFTENQLSWQILWLIDLLMDNEDYFHKNLNLLIEHSCKVWTKFLSECRFCGEIKKTNRDLARNRLSLIALYSWCLKVLLNQLNYDLENLN